ncbi:MAG: hypothetical protein ACRDTE_11010 [Pseudonocardiaceae bacterium]
MNDPLIHTGGRPVDPATLAATRAAHPEAVRVAGAAVIARFDDDHEAFAQVVSRFLARTDPVVFCGRFNSLISVLLNLAARAAAGAAGPGELICLSPTPGADASERAAITATSYAAGGDTSAATDVLIAYRDQHPGGSDAAPGVVALIGALTGLVVTLVSGHGEFAEHPDPP